MKNFTNKKLIYSLVVIVVLLVVGFFVYQYWEKGTPGYSLHELQTGLTAHNVTMVNNRLDIDAVANNFWPRYKAKYLEVNNMSSNVLAVSLVDQQEKALKDGFKNGLYEVIRGNVNKNSDMLNLFTKLASVQNPQFTISGDNAQFTMNYQSSVNNKNYPLDFVWSRQQDRTWRLTDIQGLEDSTLATSSQQ